MRCLLLLSALLVAARGATVTNSVSTSGSSNGGQTTFTSHRFSSVDPSSSLGSSLGNRGSFGASRRPSTQFAAAPAFGGSVLGNRFNNRRPAGAGGLFAVQAQLGQAAGQLAAAQHALAG